MILCRARFSTGLISKTGRSTSYAACNKKFNPTEIIVKGRLTTRFKAFFKKLCQKLRLKVLIKFDFAKKNWEQFYDWSFTLFNLPIPPPRTKCATYQDFCFRRLKLLHAIRKGSGTHKDEKSIDQPPSNQRCLKEVLPSRHSCNALLSYLIFSVHIQQLHLQWDVRLASGSRITNVPFYLVLLFIS